MSKISSTPALKPRLPAAACFGSTSTGKPADASGSAPLGGFHALGFGFGWYDLAQAEVFDWSQNLRAGNVELCLNLEGRGAVAAGSQVAELRPRTTLFYFHGDAPLKAERQAGERHQFITVAFSPAFLEEHLAGEVRHLHPLVQGLVEGSTRRSFVSAPEPMNGTVLHVVESLRRCPVFRPAQGMWFRCKALELAAQLFFRPPEGELFCTRQQRAACERTVRVREILCQRLADPPSLEELGRLVGCSPHYLSRQFSDTAGVTIQQFLRQARLERAAELLRAGKHNVTEAALEVGYNSLSHFTIAFRDLFGCCPGLYPLKTTATSMGSGALRDE
jgi:AraC-like DNA-binding protein